MRADSTSASIQDSTRAFMPRQEAHSPSASAGSIVGILGVSGLTEFEDHDLVVEVLSEHAARRTPDAI